MFGGHCKQSQFEENGQRRIGPQASNDFGVPREGSGNQMDELFHGAEDSPRIHVAGMGSMTLRPLRIPRDNTIRTWMGLTIRRQDIGRICSALNGCGTFFANGLEGTPFSGNSIKRDLMKRRDDDRR